MFVFVGIKIKIVLVLWVFVYVFVLGLCIEMIEECTFKSRIRHHEFPGCNLTPTEIICPGEENCILYQIYFHAVQNK